MYGGELFSHQYSLHPNAPTCPYSRVAIAGIVHSRWMFFLKRFMKTLKGIACQRARPEGSMDEAWLVQESLVFIGKFLSSTDLKMP